MSSFFVYFLLNGLSIRAGDVGAQVLLYTVLLTDHATIRESGLQNDHINCRRGEAGSQAHSSVYLPRPVRLPPETHLG